jgi:hypothetical protein
MLRKTLSAVAAVAAVAAMGVGTAGVANASTPIVKSAVCIPAAIVAGCTHPGHPGFGFGHGLGGALGFGRGGLLHTGLLGSDRFRGGRFGGNFGNNFGGTYWERDGIIQPYSEVVSACGCSSVPAGWVEVQDPQQVIVVPEGAATGDGSCALTSVNWGSSGWNRGVRRFRY